MTENRKRPGRPRSQPADTATQSTAPEPTPDDGYTTVTVRPGTLVVVDGQQVGGEVRVPADLAAEWIRQHWVSPTQ